MSSASENFRSPAGHRFSLSEEAAALLAQYCKQWDTTPEKEFDLSVLFVKRGVVNHAQKPEWREFWREVYRAARL